MGAPSGEKGAPISIQVKGRQVPPWTIEHNAAGLFGDATGRVDADPVWLHELARDGVSRAGGGRT